MRFCTAATAPLFKGSNYDWWKKSGRGQGSAKARRSAAATIGRLAVGAQGCRCERVRDDGWKIEIRQPADGADEIDARGARSEKHCRPIASAAEGGAGET